MRLELEMTYEIIDSLLVNDSLHWVKEDYLRQTIETRDKRYSVLEKQKELELGLKDQELKKLKKRQRYIIGGGGLALIAILIFK
jgi:hypothetical protein